MRSRGDTSGSVFTADTIADNFGVVKGSYTSIALPATETYQVLALVNSSTLQEAVHDAALLSNAHCLLLPYPWLAKLFLCWFDKRSELSQWFMLSSWHLTEGLDCITT